MPWCHRVHYDIVDTYCDYFVNDSSYVLIITKTKPYKTPPKVKQKQKLQHFVP